MTKYEIINAIKATKTRSAWDRGINAYALDLLADLADSSPITKETLLNGADNWNQYSWGGCSLAYDSDIAERVCTPSELKKSKGGKYRPNSCEEWLDVQARALYQAASRILRLAKQLS